MQKIKSESSPFSISKEVMSVVKNRFEISVGNNHPYFDAIATSILNMKIKEEAATLTNNKNKSKSTKETHLFSSINSIKNEQV